MEKVTLRCEETAFAEINFQNFNRAGAQGGAPPWTPAPLFSVGDAPANTHFFNSRKNGISPPLPSPSPLLSETQIFNLDYLETWKMDLGVPNLACFEQYLRF